MIHGGGDQQDVGVDVLCEEGCGAVLLDDGCGTLQVVALAEHRNTAASAGDDDLIRVKECLDGVDLDDGLRGRGRNDTLEYAIGDHLHMVAVLLFLTCFLGVHQLTDALDRIIEALVIRIDHHLGDDGGCRLIDASLHELGTHCVLQVVADHALAHRRAYMKRGVYVLLRIRLREVLHRGVDHTYLRCVREYQCDLIAVLDEIADHRCGTCNGGLLLRKGEAQILMSERNDHSLFAHAVPPLNSSLHRGLRYR